MMTWSPVSMWGAKVGLCLPRRMRATAVARRPRTRPSASTTYQARWISDAFGEYVGTRATFMDVRCGCAWAKRGPGATDKPTAVGAETASWSTTGVAHQG